VLAKERGVAVIDDLGSGVIAERDDQLGTALSEEPAARRSVAAGADVACFSGDKLLGGPQAGVVAGRREALEALRTHPMARAVRIDKLSLAALEATLRLHLDPQRAARALPVLGMLSASLPELEARAERLSRALHEACPAARVEIADSSGRAGGGSLPLLELDGPVVRVRPHDGDADRLHRRLRLGSPAVVARVRDGALLLDPRTISEAEIAPAAAAVIAALA
jgi:L-seryl-tRNA(Ser) seleniumtransferase